MSNLKANTIIAGDAIETLKTLPDGVFNTCVTSPPYYGLRDYGVDGQIGLEETPEMFVSKLVEVFREVRRVLKDDGTLWLNLGDSYCGSTSETKSERVNSPIAKGTVLSQESREGRGGRTKAMLKNNIKPKDLIGIPWMVAFALRADGWYLRQDIIWHKPNPMPESVTDRCTKSHEYVFLLSKSQKYYYDHESIKNPVKKDWGLRNRTHGKYHNNGTGLQPHSGLDKSYEMANKRSVWTVNTVPFRGAHFATFPEELIIPCIKAGAPEGGLVLDPFMGAGTTAIVAKKLNRNYFGIELNPANVALSNERLLSELGMFAGTISTQYEELEL